MKSALSFDDVLLVPTFSFIKSRKDVDTSVDFLGLKLKLGVISSNMDSVTGPAMAKAMKEYGAIGCLHRFWSISDNVIAYLDSPKETIVSVGLGEQELERAKLLYNAGARRILIDVAHGACIPVVEQTKALREALGNDFYLIVGNFATKQSISDFKHYLGDYRVDAWKIGIGGGSACTTRMVTGAGIPTLASILDCEGIKEPIIADGGIRNSGDFAKALAAGATVVMCGQLLAGSDESCPETVDGNGCFYLANVESENTIKKCDSNIHPNLYKKYRGSASASSYEVQGKNAEHRTPEGESFLVPYSGPVSNTLQTLEAGLRSSMSYMGANNLNEFQECNFTCVTVNGASESKAHGKN